MELDEYLNGIETLNDRSIKAVDRLTDIVYGMTDVGCAILTQLTRIADALESHNEESR